MKNIKNEVIEAYCDCNVNLPWEETSKRRNLNFRASEAVSRDEAVNIAARAIPGGYNAFEAVKLKLLPSNVKVQFAREGSVCLYVTPALEEIPAMEADEWDSKGNETRIWWD
jgi:hypothetical protein